MNQPEKTFKVIVGDEEFQVQIEDITINPVIACVNGKEYKVFVEDNSAPSFGNEGNTRESETGNRSPESPQVNHAQGIRNHTTITAPIPGDIIQISVKPGQRITAGQDVCVLEAMKMKNLIRSSHDGTIRSVDVHPGQSVRYGDVLVQFE